MKNILFLLAILCNITSNAQNYLITFTGAGAASTVDSVRVENLITGTSITLQVNEILQLTGTVGIPSSEFDNNVKMKIYPNPMKDYSMIEISPVFEGDAIITVLDMTGRLLSQTQDYFEKSKQELIISGLKDGLFLINVRGKNYQYSGKLLCYGQSGGTISIEKVSNNIEIIDDKSINTKEKGAQDGSYVMMSFTTGDRLKYTGYSGNYGTVTTDIPNQDKTIEFNFVPLSDGLHHYLTVQIGTQIWMADNLNTAKYNDGTDIPMSLSSSSPGFCWWNNSSISDRTFGALYNWHAVNTGKLCPTGWRVPSNFDWYTLSVYLGGDDVTGGKLKETGTKNWIDPNYAATNEVGFTALPAGRYDGSFRNRGYAGSWWSSTEIPGGSFAYYRSIYNSMATVIKDNFESRGNYFSVRCIKE